MRKFSVDASVMVSSSFLPCRCIPRNPNAFPVSGSVRLTFNKGWFPDRQFAPHLYSGKDLLDILSGFRAGDLNLFNS
jgi:hypothetical protein